MTHIEAVQHALLRHLKTHLPAVGGHVYFSPQAQTHVPLVPVGSPILSKHSQRPEALTANTRNSSGTLSLWVHGPSWRRNGWAACVPDPVVREGETFTRYHSPPAFDLLYDVLVLSRSSSGMLIAATQFCSCMAHHGTIQAPLRPLQGVAAKGLSGSEMSRKAMATYEVIWDSHLLTRDIVNTSKWHTLSGRLCVQGVLIDGMVVAEQGRIAQKPARVETEEF